MEFKDKVIVVTGGSRGIGAEIARVFAEQGAEVISISRGYTKITKTNENISISNIQFDIKKTDKISDLVGGVIKRHKKIDILINNAGINNNKSCWETSSEELNDEMLVNFVAPAIFSKEIGKFMRKKREGVIINIGSVKGFEASGDPGYGASKAAMASLTKSFAKELGQYGVRVNMVVPGMTETDMIKNMSSQKKSDYQKMTALGKFSSVSDIASAVLFLASEKASNITGAFLGVDGGYRL